MPNQINSSSSLWKLNQSDIFADGKNDQSQANAGATVTASLAEGQATTTAAIDGDLSQIDTGAEALALDPTENTSGNAAKAFSSTFLLRWVVKILQGISGKIPSGAATESTLTTIRDRARASAVFTGTVQTSATGADFVALPSNPATSVILYNRSGTEISWRYGSSGQELRIADGIGEEISVVGNSNTIQIRRTDQSNTQVTINFRGELR